MSTVQLSRLEVMKLMYRRDYLRNSKGPVYMIYDRTTGLRKQVVNEADLFRFLDKKQYRIEVGDKQVLVNELNRKIEALAA